MHLVTSQKVNLISPAPRVLIKEYLMPESAISGAIAEISGRYPRTGFAVNKTCKELVYIISGSGNIVTKSQAQKFAAGVSIFIDKNEAFYWQGNFTMYMVTTPTFNSKQHVLIK